MADLGGIPGQVASELKSLVKDIAKGTVETLTGTTPSPKADQPLAAATDLAAKRRLDEVRGELQAYYEEEKKKKEQTEQVAEEQKKMEEIQIVETQKKQEERQVLGRLSRQYGGTAEVDKSGY